jgi:hypothetical protein
MPIGYESIQVNTTSSRVSFWGIPFTQYHIQFHPCWKVPLKKGNSQMDSFEQVNPAAPSLCQYTLKALWNSVLLPARPGWSCAGPYPFGPDIWFWLKVVYWNLLVAQYLCRCEAKLLFNILDRWFDNTSKLCCQWFNLLNKKAILKVDESTTACLRVIDRRLLTMLIDKNKLANCCQMCPALV